jgi:hypothetical protein
MLVKLTPVYADLQKAASIHELQSKKVCEEQHLQIKVIHLQLGLW